MQPVEPACLARFTACCAKEKQRSSAGVRKLVRRAGTRDLACPHQSDGQPSSKPLVLTLTSVSWGSSPGFHWRQVSCQGSSPGMALPALQMAQNHTAQCHCFSVGGGLFILPSLGHDRLAIPGVPPLSLLATLLVFKLGEGWPMRRESTAQHACIAWAAWPLGAAAMLQLLGTQTGPDLLLTLQV